jgi:tetratricopeptide (TPR) repeat protein
MRDVAAKWVAAVGMVIALGGNLSVALHAQDAKSISDQEACDRIRTLLPLAQRYDHWPHRPLINAKIIGTHLVPEGITFNLEKMPDFTVKYADMRGLFQSRGNFIEVKFNTVGPPDNHNSLEFPDGRVDVRAGFFAALNYLVDAAHKGRPCDCTGYVVNSKTELNDFPEKTAAWRAMTTKPALSDEVVKKRLLAEDAVQEKNFDAAVNYYKAGVAIDPTWAQGWYNAALISAEMKNYPAAAFNMKHYLILLPDASDAPAAKEKLMLWEAKAEETSK